ncbi:hypothetical protein C4J83_2504 [Pseudomonas sp. LBUM920]|nr:hypothetical protein C4J83_2504 [Pseudomonas sp. LBUM920]
MDDCPFNCRHVSRSSRLLDDAALATRSTCLQSANRSAASTRARSTWALSRMK